jgi:tRNA nucleotidyltransferase (CCA-adding enzyme)
MIKNCCKAFIVGSVANSIAVADKGDINVMIGCRDNCDEKYLKKDVEKVLKSTKKFNNMFSHKL